MLAAALLEKEYFYSRRKNEKLHLEFHYYLGIQKCISIAMGFHDDSLQEVTEK
jgi:hypothetical protein